MELDKVQRKAAKMIEGMSQQSYKERFKRLKLFKREMRKKGKGKRTRIYKIVRVVERSIRK